MTDPLDPLAARLSQEPRSLVIPAPRAGSAQSVGLALVDIPARLLGGDGVSVTVDGPNYHLGLSIEPLQIAEGQPNQQWMPCWVEGMAIDEIRRVPVNAIPQDSPHDGKTYGRLNGAWSDVNIGLTVTWGAITGKPATFPPSAHTHPESDVINLTADLAAKEPAIAVGNPAYFWRGDKTWAAVPPAGVAEAPNDGQQYARQSLGWSVVVGGSGGGIPEAPLDGQSYARKGSTSAWTALPAAVTWSTLTGKPATFPPTLPIAQTDVTGLTAALAAKEPAIAAGTTGQYWRGDKAWVTLDKTAVGLANVDNTSDVNKPVSTAQATSIATKEPTLPAGGTTANFLRGDKTWQPVPAAGAKITTGTSAPGSPADNDLWFNPDTVALFIRYNDGTSTQWVQIG